MDKLPPLPDDDSDFTPDLARKLLAKYQEFLADVLAENERLQDEVVYWKHKDSRND